MKTLNQLNNCVFIKDDHQGNRRIYHFAFNHTHLIKHDFLEAFIQYFHDKANKIIKNTEQITLPQNLAVNYSLTGSYREPANNHNLNDERVIEFLREVDFHNYKLARLAAGYSLSKREIQVLNLLLHNKSTKQIAYLLGLSKRTIDMYIDKLKLKFNCKTKFEMILKISNYSIYN